MCYQIEKPAEPPFLKSLKVGGYFDFEGTLVEPNHGQRPAVYCADVTGARVWHTASLREPCLLRLQSQTVVSSDSSAIYKFGKNAGKGLNTNTPACGPNICMKRVVSCSNIQCTTLMWHLSHKAQSIARPAPSLCRREGNHSYESMPPNSYVWHLTLP